MFQIIIYLKSKNYKINFIFLELQESVGKLLGKQRHDKNSGQCLTF